MCALHMFSMFFAFFLMCKAQMRENAENIENMCKAHIENIENMCKATLGRHIICIDDLLQMHRGYFKPLVFDQMENIKGECKSRVTRNL